MLYLYEYIFTHESVKEDVKVGVLIFLIIVIIVIVMMTKSKDYTPKKGSMQENRIKMQLYQEVDDITTKCFDENTTEFNSKSYFENRFIYEDCRYPEISKYMRDNLRYIGRRQIAALNVIMNNPDPERILLELKRREENIIRNLIWVCGGGEDNNCPEYIQEYRNSLYDIIYGKVPCTKENLKKIVESYEANQTMK